MSRHKVASIFCIAASLLAGCDSATQLVEARKSVATQGEELTRLRQELDAVKSEVSELKVKIEVTNAVKTFERISICKDHIDIRWIVRCDGDGGPGASGHAAGYLCKSQAAVC